LLFALAELNLRASAQDFQKNLDIPVRFLFLPLFHLLNMKFLRRAISYQMQMDPPIYRPMHRTWNAPWAVKLWPHARINSREVLPVKYWFIPDIINLHKKLAFPDVDTS